MREPQHGTGVLFRKFSDARPFYFGVLTLGDVDKLPDIRLDNTRFGEERRDMASR